MSTYVLKSLIVWLYAIAPPYRKSACDSRVDDGSEHNTQLSTVHSGTTASSSIAGPSVSPGLSTRPSSSSMFSSPSPSPSRIEPAANPAQSTSEEASVKSEYSMTPRSVQTQNIAALSRHSSNLDEMPRFNGNSKNFAPTDSPSKPLSCNLNSGSKAVTVWQPLQPPPKRIDIFELPRIPKIKKEASSKWVEPEPAGSQNCDIPSSCITQLTGKETTPQLGRGSKVESQKSNAKESQQSSASTSVYSSSSLLGTSRSKGPSSFESFKINIPGNAGHSSRLSNPGFCNTFRPVDDKAQQKESPSPLLLVKKKQVKSEMYDPFEPTGSDSSSASSSPERLGSGIQLTNITRTISIENPKVQTFQTVRRFTPYVVGNVFGSGADSDVPSSNTESHDDTTVESRIVEQISDTEERDNMDEEDFLSSPCTSSAVKQVSNAECLKEKSRESPDVFFNAEELIRPNINVKLEPDGPSKNYGQQNIQKVEETERQSCSRSSSNSSSQSKMMKRKKAFVKRHKRSQSGSRDRGRSRDRSSRSTSWSGGEEHSKTHTLKPKRRRSSTDRSSSNERSKKKKMKDKTKDKKAKTSWRRERRKSRSRSGSPGSTSESYENRKRKKQSPLRSRWRERSRSSSIERTKRQKHRRDKSYEKYDKDSSIRSRERKRSRSRSRGRRRWRSRSRSASGSQERKSSKSKEKRPRSRSHSKERKYRSRETSLPPPSEKNQKPSAEHVSGCLEQPHSFNQEPKEELVLEEHSIVIQPNVKLEEIQAETPAQMGEAQETIKVEPICQEVTSETAFPVPEITNTCVPVGNVDSFAETELMNNSDPAALGSCSNTNLEITVKIENSALCPSLMEQPSKEEVIMYAPTEAAPIQCSSKSEITDCVKEVKQECLVPNEETSNFSKPELEVVPQGPALKSKAPVKRVTWNLQEEESGMLSPAKVPSMYLSWKTNGS